MEWIYWMKRCSIILHRIRISSLHILLFISTRLYFHILWCCVFEFALCFYVRDNFFLSLHSFHLYTILLVEFFASFLSHFDFTLCHLLCVCVFLYHQCIEQEQELKLYAKEGKLPSLQCVHTIYLKTHTHSLCGSMEKEIRIIQSLLKS